MAKKVAPAKPAKKVVKKAAKKAVKKAPVKKAAVKQSGSGALHSGPPGFGSR